ncbi:hypothetical protein C7999DRAFT_44907 [Corynascus novoguineensis]|uniref:C3H1-type domain-containing protein n=1 Tax=Corynascus novoguineensis TaxID=1126955 RepID=A0AAN7CJL1_9PEZI|nr:hypothetical protein C7999DRAFT_44907 [Corynascus novoguineensis]
MASAEDREMMERISRLAGQINRHRNQQAGVGPTRHARTHHHAGYSGAWRSSGFPHRGGHSSARMPVYRNRTLVLNNGTQQNRHGDGDSGATSDASSSSWVTKNDRHLQLINTNVYKKDAQARAAAMEQTRRQKLANRDRQERAKLVNHLNRMANGGGFGAANQQAVGDKYEIAIQGVRFVVAKNGSKLVKVPGDGNSAKATPKMALVGGVKFYRSKNGNLYRHGVVKAQRYVAWKIGAEQLTPANSRRQSGAVRKVNRHASDRASVSDPNLTNRITGSCTLGPRCRYVHDPHKVAICKDYLQQGECASGDHCDLSHVAIPERTPTCLHFARDSCTKPDCKYAHVKVSPAAPVCRDFGFYGYCEKGANCSDRHVFECPDFSNTGVCKIKGCKLPHRERASVLRKGASGRDLSNMDDEEMEDISSDDDGESIDEDDVDSDEVDEFIGQDDDGGLDFAAQKDFIEL